VEYYNADLLIRANFQGGKMKTNISMFARASLISFLLLTGSYHSGFAQQTVQTADVLAGNADSTQNMSLPLRVYAAPAPMIVEGSTPASGFYRSDPLPSGSDELNNKPLTVISTIQYDDLLIDEGRGFLYAADKEGNKIDVINISDLSVVDSYLLANGALPTQIDLSPDGVELAVAQSGLDRVAFINLVEDTISEMPASLSGTTGYNPVSNPFDVFYGRSGILYVLSDSGLHTLNTAYSPHPEEAGQFVSLGPWTKFGALTADRNTLFIVNGNYGTNKLYKFDVSAGLTLPASMGYTLLFGTHSSMNIRLSLADDSPLLTSWGSVYDPSSLTLKGKNGQSLSPVTALPGHDFYVVAYEDPSGTVLLIFFDEESSHQLTYLSTGLSGSPGAMAATDNGDTLFVSSTGGMAKFSLSTTPPGTAVSLPASLNQYRDYAFDLPRGVIYGTDASGRVNVLDQDTGEVLDSYLLPNGADPIGIDLSPDGSELALALNGLEAILFLDPQTGAEIARVKPPTGSSPTLPYDVVYGRAGRLYSDGNPGSYGSDYLHAFDTLTHTWIGKSSVLLDVGSELSLTSDSRYIYASEGYSPGNILVFDVQADIPVQLYEGPFASVLAEKISIVPDGSKVFTSDGQVWSRDIQELIGALPGDSGDFIEYIPIKNAVALTVGNTIRFFSADDYQLISTYDPTAAGDIIELEVSPDGSKLVAGFSAGDMLILDLSTILPEPPPVPVPSTIKYDDLLLDEARGSLYGVDRIGNKIDVIDISDLSVSDSYEFTPGTWPAGIDLSPDGNVLAVAQSGSSRVAFIDLNAGTISESPDLRAGLYSTKVYDVLFGRPGVLYALSNIGIHVIDSNTHIEDLDQYAAGSSDWKSGVLTSDKNTLLLTTGIKINNVLGKFDVSDGLAKPVQLGYIPFASSGVKLDLADDDTLLTSWLGKIVDVSNLTIKAKNGEDLRPVIGLPGRSFYAVAHNNTQSPDALYFFDKENSHQLSMLPTGMMGTQGAMAVTDDGNNLFVSSTGGMTSYVIGATPPGDAVGLPQSQGQYRDFVFDMPRGVIYGTDASGRVDVLDQDTGDLLDSYLLSNGADPIGIDLSPDGNELAVALHGLESILFLDPDTGVEIARGFPQRDIVYGILSGIILPNDVIYGRSGRLYSNGSDKIQVFDSFTHDWLAKKNVTTTGEMTLSPDRNYLYDNSPPNNVYVYDVQTDEITQLYYGNYISAKEYAVLPDGSKVFTSGGQVWDGTLAEPLGMLEGGAGDLIEYISGQDAVVVAGQDAYGNVLRFNSAFNHRLLTAYRPPNSGTFAEMEISPDGGKLIINFSSGEIRILDISTILPVPPVPPLTGPAKIQYEDMVIDEARGRIYGVDKDDSKIDVIDMADLTVESSYLLIYGSAPAGIDLSPDGNELAVAQSGLSRVAFINLIDDTISISPTALFGSKTKTYDVHYGRPGILYVLSTKGIHSIDAITHAEDTTQVVVDDSIEKFGAVTTDKNTLFFVTGSDDSGFVDMHKFDVSAGLSKPVETSYTYLYNTDHIRDLKLSLADDSTLLTSLGSVYDTSTLTLKAKNGQSLLPVIALPGRDFYVTVSAISKSLYFFDQESSHMLSSLDTGVKGTPGAMAVTGDGNNLFVSSTGGMTSYVIGATPPGDAVDLPQSQRQYRDFVFDMPRGVIYGTDASGRVDVLDQDTGDVLDSYLLPNGAAPVGIDLSPDGNELAIAMNELESILFIDPETGNEIARVTPRLNQGVYYSNIPYDVIYGRAGRLYSNGNPGPYNSSDYIHVIDTTTHTWLARSTYPLVTGAELAITDDNKYLYANETLYPNNIHIFDVQTDAPTKIYSGPHGYVYASEFTILPDGSKVFTSNGPVWSGDMQTQIGNLPCGSVYKIKSIPGKNAVAHVCGYAINFTSSDDYTLISYHKYPYSTFNEMEVAPDGSELIANYLDGQILILDLANFSPPKPVINAPVDGSTTDDNTPTISGTAEANSTVDVYIDGGFRYATSVDSFGAWSYTPSVGLADGSHFVMAAATDPSGSFITNSNTIIFKVDTGTPAVSFIIRADPSPTYASSVDFTIIFTEPVTGVDESDFSLTTTDVSGASVSSVTAGVDQTVYTVSVNTGTGDGTIRLDLNPTGTGIQDLVGNPMSGGFTSGEAYTIDKTVPSAPIIDAPLDGSSTSDNTPTIIGTAEAECTVRIYIDGSLSKITVADGSGDWSYSPASALSDGAYSIKATATDAAGNTSLDSSTNTFTVETAPPSVMSILRAGPNPTNVLSVDFILTFSEAVTGVDTSMPFNDFTLITTGLAGEYISAVSGSGVTYTVTVDTGSGDGTIQLDVNAGTDIQDQVGNPLSGSFTSGEIYDIDRTPPDTSLDAHPLDPSTNDSPVFEFSSPDATAIFECQLDGSGYSSCSNPKGYTGLSDDSHTFDVRAFDSAGNTDPSPESYTWLIDTTPPDTSIDAKPSDPNKNDSHTFEFSSTEAPVTFECQLDGGGYSPCTSPKTYTGLSEGSHTFSVRAVDLVGFPDPTPAGYTWTIDFTRPVVRSIFIIDPIFTSSDTVRYEVNFSEAVTGVKGDDFNFSTTGSITGYAVTGVSGSGKKYEVTVSTGMYNGTLRLNVNDSGTGIKDLAGNDLNGGFAGATYRVEKTYTLMVKSQPKYDGWVLESGETTNKGGTKNNLARFLKVGDNIADKQYRSILSFGTAAIPDNAVITRIILKVKKAGLVGTDPMTTHNDLVVDVQKGKFYTLPALQINDFQAKASKYKAGLFPTSLYSGWYRAVLRKGAYDYDYINKMGRTQLRLRFLLDDDDDNLADILKLYSGNAVLANRPKLIVKYYVP